MAYRLRDRKQKGIYIDITSSSSSESDSDPDYYSSRASMQRNKKNLMKSSPSTIQYRLRKRKRQIQEQEQEQGQQDSQMAGTFPAADAKQVVRRRPGRPRRNAAQECQVQLGNDSTRERRQRSRAPYGLRDQPHSAHKNSLGTFGEKITIPALLIELEIVKENEEVHYWANTTAKGQVTRGGILCKCCEEVMTVMEFVLHAGGDDAAMPCSSIVLTKTNFTLFGCQLLGWLKIFSLNRWTFSNDYASKIENDTSDDACIMCADGGDLICCEECPLTYHPKCLGMENVPRSVWVCPSCLCTHCGQPGSEGEKITQCRLCEKSYHQACCEHSRVRGTVDGSKFCGDACIDLDRKLKTLVGLKTNLGEGFSWTLVHHSVKIARKNRGVRDFYERIEGNSKIALAWILMNQSFDPIIDRLTRIDLVRTVVYNNRSKFTRINFKGFYTVVLEKDDEMVAAASLRLRGKEMAEMPYVATSWSFRNKGMLKKLMAGIESALDYLEVENLVLPSAKDVEKMWIHKFGFKAVDSSMKKQIALSKMLMFPKSTRLMKSFALKYKQAKEDNAGQGGVVENKSKTVIPFDLNLEPPSEDEEVMCRG